MSLVAGPVPCTQPQTLHAGTELNSSAVSSEVSSEVAAQGPPPVWPTAPPPPPPPSKVRYRLVSSVSTALFPQYSPPPSPHTSHPCPPGVCAPLHPPPPPPTLRPCPEGALPAGQSAHTFGSSPSVSRASGTPAPTGFPSGSRRKGSNSTSRSIRPTWTRRTRTALPNSAKTSKRQP